MPNTPPPEVLPGVPRRITYPAGTPVLRVHATRRPPAGFNPVPARTLYGGGRFDSTPYHPYGFLYVGLHLGATVCETFLRSLPFPGDGGHRIVPRSAVAGRSLSFLRLVRDTEVVSLLSAGDLAAVAQDTWLVQAEAAEYPQTRDWGHWIREQTKPWAQGFVWRSKREPEGEVAVLFEDRCHGPAVEPYGVAAQDFDTPGGEDWLNGVLRRYHAQVAPSAAGRGR